ncbi:uncharacterized protein LOC117317871 isoform X2 [Pecten maximus]|uniref:uncharacterized protein LOC117317871 isoform X2 n=1 Tax=Pecten maximus TaxID=6579 RepID=UPI001457E5C6|nr:uncharacterized protein LOC117317871 isoform X2 [Pecten maximus]
MGKSRSENTLFRWATKTYVKSVGSRNLRAVPDVHSSHKLMPLSIVVKRPNKKWFRRTKHDYSIRESKLTDFLGDTSKLDMETKIKDHVINYRNTDCTALDTMGGFNVLGAFLARYKRKAGKCQTFDSGRTIAESVEKEDLMKALKNRKININYPVLSQILKVNKSSIVCVVVEVIRTTKPVNIKEEVRSLDEADVKFDMVDGSGGLSLRMGRGKQTCPELSIEPTVLAYEVCELEVDMTKGTMDLVVDPEGQGGFVNIPDDIDICEGIADDTVESNYMLSLYETLEEMSTEERNIVREIATMSADDADIICQIMYQTGFDDIEESSSEESLNDSFESMSVSSYSTISTDDEPVTPVPTLHQDEFFEDCEECSSGMGLEDLFESMRNSSCSSSSGGESMSISSSSLVGDSEPTSPADDTTSPPIQLDTVSVNDMNNQIQTADEQILYLTSKPQAFRRMLEVIGWQIMDGTMAKPDDTKRMDLFECFFVLMKRLHHEHTAVIEDINSFSSTTRKHLCGIYRWYLTTSQKDKSEEAKRQLCEDHYQLKNDIDPEEFSRVEELCKHIKDRSYVTCAVYSMLLALS